MNVTATDQTGPDVQIRNVRKSYELDQNQVEALKDVSIELSSNSFCIIYGPSGSGKSTLLHILAAMDHATSGTVEVGGKKLNSLSGKERTAFRKQEVGFIFQSLNLLQNLTALENVLIPFIPEGGYHKMVDRAKQMLVDVGLGERFSHRPGRLSGGEQQRVAIARALLKQPSLILADEPTGELDTDTGEEIFSLLREARDEQNATVIVATHDTEFIQEDDVTLRLRDGVVKKD